MQFFSTRDTNRKVTSSEAIAQGLSDEGGLFVPESFPQVDVRALCELDYPALAAAVIREYLTDYSPEFLAQAARTTYGEAFGGKAGYLAPVEGDTYALELWHGPTCAFKDYALQLMPRLLVEAKKNLGRTEKTLILVATSGDTGKAALDGYHDIPGVEIAVFYPTGGTSEIQRLQMATQEGANVAVYAVRGNFDDAQTGVKRSLATRPLPPSWNSGAFACPAQTPSTGAALYRRSSTTLPLTHSCSRPARSPSAMPWTSVCPLATSATFWQATMPSAWVCPWVSWSVPPMRTTS